MYLYSFMHMQAQSDFCPCMTKVDIILGKGVVFFFFFLKKDHSIFSLGRNKHIKHCYGKLVVHILSEPVGLHFTFGSIRFLPMEPFI